MTHNGHRHAAAPGRRILVIDDEPLIRTLAARALSRAGFTVVQADTGLAGLRIALREPCDLVLLDLGLPDLDGEELLRRLRRARPGQAVLVCSATGDLKGAAWCHSLGAIGYLPKPFTLTELLQSIEAGCPESLAS